MPMTLLKLVQEAQKLGLPWDTEIRVSTFRCGGTAEVLDATKGVCDEDGQIILHPYPSLTKYSSGGGA